MHELSLAHEVVRIVCEVAQQHQLRRVQRYLLEVGELRGVVPEMLRTCLEVVARGTSAEGAAAELHAVPGRARCAVCAGEFHVPDVLIVCPTCGRIGGEILAGDELRVIELEGE